MLNRRTAILALPAMALAACSQGPVADNEFLLGGDDVVRGAADGVRTAAFGAQRAFGDTSAWRGNPIAACFGTAQLEYLARNFTENARFDSTANFTTIHTVQQAQRELRQAAGIPASATSARLENDLRLAVRELSIGNRPAAEARLAAYGPGLIDRLTNLPRLRRVEEAAGAVASEFSRARDGSAGTR